VSESDHPLADDPRTGDPGTDDPGTDDPGTGDPGTGILDQVLHLGAGLSDADRSWVLDALSVLERHLSRWDPADVSVDVSVKDRGGREQQLTVRADLPGYPPVVAKAAHPDLLVALAEAKRELIRQVEEEKQKREPKNNRRLRRKAT
jgi:ribosome-associated translation inhibitor RaiA